MNALLFSSPVKAAISNRMEETRHERGLFEKIKKPIVVCLDLALYNRLPYPRFEIGKWVNVNFCAKDVLDKTNDVCHFLERANAVCIPGGNTFLHNAFVKYSYSRDVNSVFDVLKRKCQEPNFLYMGTSAGAILGCPDIEIARFADTDIIGDKHLDGLNLVDFYIKPHFDAWIKDVPTFKKFAKNTGKTVVGLFEGSYVEISGNSTKILGQHYIITGESAKWVHN